MGTVLPCCDHDVVEGENPDEPGIPTNPSTFLLDLYPLGRVRVSTEDSDRQTDDTETTEPLRLETTSTRR